MIDGFYSSLRCKRGDANPDARLSQRAFRVLQFA
jgi:hypothetical protein